MGRRHRRSKRTESGSRGGSFDRGRRAGGGNSQDSRQWLGQPPLLRAVKAAEGQSQQAIGERLQIPASRMVAFVDALQARGLLERRHNPQDRRARALHLTDDGRDLLGRALTLAIGLERELCAELSTAERDQLIDLLQRVGSRLGLSPGTHAAHADHPIEEDAPAP